MEQKPTEQKPAAKLMNQDWQKLMSERLYEWVAYGPEGFLTSTSSCDELYAWLDQHDIGLHLCTISQIVPWIEVDETGMPIVRLYSGGIVGQ